MSQAILITQCLQNDFVMPIEKYDPLPNRLHIGYAEALRLMGENPEHSPVRRLIQWAYAQGAEKLSLIHIRDWHNPEDDGQREHFNHFGSHCIPNSPGARFVFEDLIPENPVHTLIDSPGLNDFEDTPLKAALDTFGTRPLKVGLAGVWTEAKIFFLAYELSTRYPHFEIGLCSALTASSSRAAHFNALDQIEKILGVKVFSSVGDFSLFLAGSLPDLMDQQNTPAFKPRLILENAFPVSDSDEALLCYLFRDCRKVELKSLDGGFSGNLVLKARGFDLQNRRQVPTVVKIGDRHLIARERMAFEQVQEVLGNTAPHIVEWSEMGQRGGIKYRYASMLDTKVQTFQDFFEQEKSFGSLSERFLETVFQNHLGRFYDAAEYEKLNLLEYYDFNEKYNTSVRKNVEAVSGRPALGETLTILPGIEIFNVCRFYEEDLPRLKESPPSSESHYMAFVHGDLNGKNIIIDHQSNVWLIDFFHTHRGHVLKDLIKLENDILYIFTKIHTEEELKEAFKLTDILLDTHDLRHPPAKNRGADFSFAPLRKAFLAVRKLRSFYGSLIRSDRDPYQLFVGLMRYAMHTLSFEECSDLQKKWALYAGAKCAEKIRQSLLALKKLRVDWIGLPAGLKGKLGITLLPGRKDRDRDLSEDLQTLKEAGITDIVCLMTHEEMTAFGVPGLLKAYEDAGFEVFHFPILDQGITEPELALPLYGFMEQGLKQGKNILIHCVGGLGRSGMMAAAFLKRQGVDAESALHAVRKARSPRAVETHAQEEFVRKA